MLYIYCSPECCCVIYYLTFIYNDLASRVSKIFVYLVAILTCSINCVYDLVYYRTCWYSIPENYKFLIKELWKRNCTSWIDNEEDCAQSNALMDNNGTIAKRRISDKINDKNPDCLKWRRLVVRISWNYIYNTEKILFLHWCTGDRTSHVAVSASLLTFFGIPKEFSFSFLAGGFIEYAYGDCTYLHWLRALNTESRQLYQCTVHILDTECVGEYDLWRADLSFKINTIIIRNINCTLMISYYIYTHQKLIKTHTYICGYKLLAMNFYMKYF